MNGNVERLENGNYRHRYAVERELPDDWWYTRVEVFSNSPAVANLNLTQIDTSLAPAKLNEAVVNEWVLVYQTGLTAGLRPFSIYIDMTCLGRGEYGKARGEIISAHCFDRDAVPLIDEHPKHGWVFHTLFAGDPMLAYKKKIASFFDQVEQREVGTEVRLEQRIAQTLRYQGHKVQRQVHCRSGVADIVTEAAVYEIKPNLSRGRLFEAIGQVLIYRQAINPSLKAIVVGAHSNGNINGIIRYARKLGVEVKLFRKGKLA